MNTINIKSPGRVCLFGDHQDYLGLPVIACAINRYIHLTATVNSTSFLRIKLPDIHSERLININDQPKALDKRDYFGSSLKVLKRYGCIPSHGYDINITGDIPINAGVSSSSALIVAWIKFLIEAYGLNHEITPELIGKIAFEAEVLEHGEPGGFMDQYTISLGNVVHIETDSNISFTTLRNQLEGLIIAESGILKNTIVTLGDRKDKAIQAIDYVKSSIPEFNIKSANLGQYDDYKEYMPLELRPYFYAAIKNHMITLEALHELKKKELNMNKIGALMNEHHRVLRDNLKITVPLIDTMIDTAIEKGAFGAKIVGSGGGGSIVILAPKDRENEIILALKNVGANNAYKVKADEGVRLN